MQTFAQIVFATQESERWHKVGLLEDKISVYDFRHGQICHRLQMAENTLATKACYVPFKQYLAQWPREKRVIIGSAWPPEIAILHNAAWAA